ncbi:MAG: MBL fold metallo-hydrolase [Magnetococcales bacterium]|nr:MBL fold metallo-hydrolase [Magnetococcales bacterium]
MRITILGSGTGIPSVERCASGYLLQATNKNYLIDCGSGILRQLEHNKTSFSEIDALFITHSHSDHIGDLTSMVHAFRLPTLQRSKPFHIYGPENFINFFNNIIRPVVTPPTKFPFFIKEAPVKWRLGSLTITTCNTVHSKNFKSLAYRFDEYGKSAVFSGDCDLDQDIITLAKKTDLLVCDCSTLAEGKIPGHLSALEAGQVAQQAQVKHLVPTHFYPINGPDSLRAAECAKHYSGPITLAEDLLKIIL